MKLRPEVRWFVQEYRLIDHEADVIFLVGTPELAPRAPQLIQHCLKKSQAGSMECHCRGCPEAIVEHQHAAPDCAGIAFEAKGIPTKCRCNSLVAVLLKARSHLGSVNSFNLFGLSCSGFAPHRPNRQRGF